ncbi:hypothetical protein PHLCEN_2v10110 [Hermanssonia centrifuga]|uniref:Glycosyltransferase family 15 protein n=1 Tax=Hermanssonia centrifuga TaxID=98765 RepID=A0A2R6NNY2_9APHY|nr:hypothetical protein PHLCEN_2v10110 [Hermanssonia centrifuga]
MMTPMRYILLVLGIIISLHFILSFSHEDYGRATSLSSIKSQIAGSKGYPPYKDGIPEEYYQSNGTIPSPQGRKANATFVLLARNSDLNGIAMSMKQMEDRFNKKFQYPYVFLNEEPFSEEFKSRVSELTDAPIQFGLIPHDHWYQPDWVDEEKASAARADMVRNQVIYGGIAICADTTQGSFTAMSFCKTTSITGGLSTHYHIYFKGDRITYFALRRRPDVTFFCDLDYDPFLIMEDQKKVYGFTVSLYEYPATIPTLWETVREFIDANPDLVEEGNAMNFISDDGGNNYNRCHFWSNFEIGDLDFWRDVPYTKFFEFLDSKGGFYYERWGDAPVHSIGAALFAKKEQIHFFSDIGYRHNPFQHCPQGDAHKKGKCWCNPNDNFDYEGYSCLNRYDKMF